MTDKIERQFQEFHKANPEVYARLMGMALSLKDKGREHYSIDGLFHVLRFHKAMQTDDSYSSFKLNNNDRALYARELMKNVPALHGFFEIRVRYPRGTQHHAPRDHLPAPQLEDF